MPSGLRIEGVAYLPEPGEEWIVPGHDVPLDLCMDPRRPIGRATLTGHPDGSITCVATIPQFIATDGLVEALKTLPVLALTGARLDGPAYSVMRVNVAGCNVNPLIPPYRLEVVDGQLA